MGENGMIGGGSRDSCNRDRRCGLNVRRSIYRDSFFWAGPLKVKKFVLHRTAYRTKEPITSNLVKQRLGGIAYTSV